MTVRANSAIGAISSITTLPLAGSPTQENVDSDSENPVAVFHTEDVSTALTAEIIQSRRAAIDAAQGVSDEIKAQLRQQLDRSADFLNQKLKIEQRLASVKAEVDSGPAEISALRKTLEQPGLAVDIQLPVDAGVAELEKLRATDQEQLAEVTGKLESWETRAKNRSERRPQMPALIESARAELEAANEGLLAIKTVESQTPETVAARTEKEALVELKRTELEMLRAEQARYEALSDLFPLQRDDLTRSRNSLERRLEQWDSALVLARQQEVRRQETEASRKLEEAHPELREVAERNSQLTRERTAIQQSINGWNAELNAFNRTLTVIEDKFEEIVEQEKLLGLTTPIGLELRSDRASLPNRRQLERRLRTAEEEIRGLHTARFRLDSERRQLADIETAFEAVLESLSETAREDRFLLDTARSYLTQKRDYLDSLLADHQTALDTLGKIDSVCRRLLNKIDQYQQYIDQRVLWIRSVSPLTLRMPLDLVEAVREWIALQDRKLLEQFLLQDAKETPTVYLLFGLVMGILVLLDRQYRHLLEKLHSKARGPLKTGMPQHLFGLLLTVVVALTVPWIIGFLGSRLLRADQTVIASLGYGLWISAIHLWVVNSFLRLLIPRGFAERFLDWPQEKLPPLRAALKLYRYLGIPLALIFVSINRFENPIFGATIGRLAFVLECGLLLIILRKILRPDGPIIVQLLTSNPHSRIYHWRWLWYPLALFLPVYLSILSVMGYQYTAEQLMIRFQWTLVLAGGLSVLYALACKWVVASRRKLAIHQAQLRRQAELAAQQESDQSENSDIPPPNLEHEVDQVDLSQLNRQGLQFVSGVALLLFFAGCWGIWAQVLPALQFFSNYEVWSTTQTVTRLIAGDAGEPRSVQVTTVVPTTLGHLMAAALVLTGALFAGRNLPSLLELSVLQRLPIEKGSRDAIKLASGYALVIGGLIVSSNIVGLQWSNIQWLAAALTVGLGFGLQEIFANFVAGVIILFERPVRLGDIVTIDNVSGTVTRIQIRATTITDWDRKEYIVPNKEFVTGKLLNWTLSDRINRILIEVGVAYGTNVQMALDLLLDIAQKHPIVLSEPGPAVSFDRFGESTLNLSLRCFLPALDQRLRVLTELNQEIAKRFETAGIEIAFPQRDLHLRSIPRELTALLEKPQSLSENH